LVIIRSYFNKNICITEKKNTGKTDRMQRQHRHMKLFIKDRPTEGRKTIAQPT
jgi:hypothetical protein